MADEKAGQTAAPGAREAPGRSQRASQQPGQQVVLQMEVTTRTQARVVQLVMWGLLSIFLGTAITLLAFKSKLQQRNNHLQRDAFYKVTLGLAAACLAALTATGATFLRRWRREVRRGRQWSPHQQALVVSAAVLLLVQWLMCLCWMVPYAAVVAASCLFPAELVAVFALLRWTCLSTLLLWMTVVMHGMTLHASARSRLSMLDRLGWRSRLSMQAPALDRCPSAKSSTDSEEHVQEAAHSHSTQQQPAVNTQPAGLGSGSSGAGEHADAGVVGQQLPSGALSSEEAGGAGAATRPAAAPSPAEAAIIVPSCGSSGGDGSGSSGGLPVGPDGPSVPHIESNSCDSKQPQLQPLPHPLLPWQLQPGDVPADGIVPPRLHPQLLVIELPVGQQVRLHTPKLLLWLVLEGAAMLGLVRQWEAGKVEIALDSACLAEESEGCEPKTREIVSMVLELAVLAAYIGLYYWYQYRAFVDHRSLPYVKYRITSIFIRVERFHVSIVMMSVILDNLMLVLAGADSCWAFVMNQLGMPPEQLSFVVMTLLSLFLYMPAGKLGVPIAQALLQEFAWTEAALSGQKAHRNAQITAEVSQLSSLEGWALPALLPDLAAPALGLAKKEGAARAALEALLEEPMFCMERAVKLFLWSRLAYQCTVPDSPVKESTALELFGLQHCDCLREPSTDTQGLVGWSPSRGVVVLSFRGTCSMQNVVTDAKLYKTWHEPRRRHQGIPVRVHKGFYQAWTQAGFGKRVLDRLKEIVTASQASEAVLTFYLTGHSLGGALACLAAYEVRQHWPRAEISLYTFGAPRVGNRGWAVLFNEVVPDSWGIINSEDPVPRVPKILYKHAGRRVSIDEEGDIIVRPSYFELSVLNKPGGRVGHHSTGTYALALAAILKAQFVPGKSMPGGWQGVEELAASVDLGAALVLKRMALKDLMDPNVSPKPIPVRRPKKRQGERRLGGEQCGALCCMGRQPRSAPPSEGEVPDEFNEDGQPAAA